MKESTETEKFFIKTAKEAGFKVKNSRPIISPEPVENRRGKKKKRITLPDCSVSDPGTHRQMYVEVTNGSRNSSHKKAQKRVVKAAGIKNYRVVAKKEVEKLRIASTKAEKRAVILAIFGWLLLM